jgi:hypothetical protein
MNGEWVYVGHASDSNGLGGAAQVLAVHAALLPVGATGKILYFGGSQWIAPVDWAAIENESNFQIDPGYRLGKSEIDHARIYDCYTRVVSNPNPDPSNLEFSPDSDLFCSGHAFLVDGRLLVAGGTQHYPNTTETDLHHAHWSGIRQTWIFDPHTTTWIKGPLMNRDPKTGSGGGRWYPTLITLQNGNIIAMCGHPLIGEFAQSIDDYDDRHNNTNPEIYDPAIQWGVSAERGATVTTLWRNSNHQDLFMTGTDGTVYSTFWEQTPSWQTWFPIHQETQAQPGATVTALWRNSNHLDLFMTGTDGTVYSTFWEQTPSWQTWFKILPMFGKWTLAPQLGVDSAHDYAVFYPRLHVIPHTGEVFIVQPLYSSSVTYSPDCAFSLYPNLCSPNPEDTDPLYGINVMDMSLFYDVDTQLVTRAFLGPPLPDTNNPNNPSYVDPLYTSQETSSIMLPLLHEENYHPRVLICNAMQPYIADLAQTDPSWTPTAQRQLIDSTTHQPVVRNYASSTLLPTGDVVITGGFKLQRYPDSSTAVKTVEVYHAPSQDHPFGSWELGPDAHEARGYHSVALLVPDGRIWTAGSELNARDSTDKRYNTAIELFEPNYYQSQDRISIVRSPTSVTYGQTFTVHFTPEDTTIARVVFMRCGSATHAFDGDQRYVSVPFTERKIGLTVTAPPDGTIAPPGYYMLWLIDANNLPCKLATFVRVGT